MGLPPVVEANGVIGWKLLQTLAKEMRAAEHALANRNRAELEAAGGLS